MARRRRHPEARVAAFRAAASARSANENDRAEGWRAPIGWHVTIVRADGSRNRHDVASYADGVVLRDRILVEDPNASCGWVLQSPIPRAMKEHPNANRRHVVGDGEAVW